VSADNQIVRFNNRLLPPARNNLNIPNIPRFRRRYQLLSHRLRRLDSRGMRAVLGKWNHQSSATGANIKYRLLGGYQLS